MSDDRNGNYASVTPGTTSDSLQKYNAMVDAGCTSECTAFGETIPRHGLTYEAQPETTAFAGKFWDMSEKVLNSGRLTTANIAVNRGGSVLPRVVSGLDELKKGNVSGINLVCTLQCIRSSIVCKNFMHHWRILKLPPVKRERPDVSASHLLCALKKLNKCRVASIVVDQ